MSKNFSKEELDRIIDRALEVGKKHPERDVYVHPEVFEEMMKRKFRDCAYETKKRYCKPEDCETCKGVTDESIADFDNYMKKKKEEANSW